jgi:hypothetical protein
MIKLFVTRGVTVISPEKKSRLEIYKRWRSTRNDVGCIDTITSKQGKTYTPQILENARALGPGSDLL